MVTRLEKSELVDYSNDDWYTDIYHYYINQQFLLVDRIEYAIIKKQAQYYQYNSL